MALFSHCLSSTLPPINRTNRHKKGRIIYINNCVPSLYLFMNIFTPSVNDVPDVFVWLRLRTSQTLEIITTCHMCRRRLDSQDIKINTNRFVPPWDKNIFTTRKYLFIRFICVSWCEPWDCLIRNNCWHNSWVLEKWYNLQTFVSSKLFNVGLRVRICLFYFLKL